MVRTDRREFFRASAKGGVACLTLYFTGCSSEEGSLGDPLSPLSSTLPDGIDGQSAQRGASDSARRMGDGGSGDAGDGATLDSGDAIAADSGDAIAADASNEDAGDLDAGDSSTAIDASQRTVTLYDTNAVALYFDGTMGPFTGVIRVAYILANAPLTLDFWHGHNGQIHRFTLLPQHFADLKAKKRVTIETSVVDGHQHKLFIDPVDPRYRVANAPPIQVPV